MNEEKMEFQTMKGQRGGGVSAILKATNQYCRYCCSCVAQDDDVAVCTTRNEMVTKKTVRNSCQDFEFNEIDAFDLNKKYKPRNPKPKQCEGQITMFGE